MIASISWACAEHQLWAISWHWLSLTCSGWPAGFKSTCVWSSKVELICLFSPSDCYRWNDSVETSVWQFAAVYLLRGCDDASRGFALSLLSAVFLRLYQQQITGMHIGILSIVISFSIFMLDCDRPVVSVGRSKRTWPDIHLLNVTGNFLTCCWVPRQLQGCW